MSNYRILVSDPISDKGVSALADTPNISVDVKTGLSPEELLAIIADYDGLIVRSQTQVTAEVLAAATKLKVVGRAGVGVDNIDKEAATNHGVIVMNTPSGNTISTAEHAFSLMMSLARNIGHAHSSIMEGRWDRKKYQGVELYKKRLTILGMGRIGTEFAKRAQAFGMEVTAYDPFLTQTRADSLKVQLASTVEEALTDADVVTMHIPLTEESKHIINKDRLPLLAKGALIVNCARGGLIHEDDLAAAIESGHIGGCALDVYENEPPNIEDAIFQQGKTVFTPHLGASTNEAQENVGIQVAEQVGAYLSTGSITNAINMPNLDANTYQAVAPYLQLGKALGICLAKLGPKQVDTINISYYGSVSQLDTAMVSREILSQYLGSAHNDAQANLINAPAVAKNLGLNVTESLLAEPQDYHEIIQVTITKGDERYSLSGTLIGNQPRIISIDQHSIEIPITGHFIVVENDDRPGIVGSIGLTLGEQKINIANMALSRSRKGNSALCILELDQLPEEVLIDNIKEIGGISSVQLITL